jgi:uncharacterized repeat protein (TIGR04138 family)
MIPDIDTRMLDVAQRYGRYKPNAYRFIYEAVGYTVEERYEATLEVRHVTGREVLEGIRDLARRKFGFMAKAVFEQWGVLATEDFGTIVFHLVTEGILSKTDSDTMSDFEHGYDFEETFVRNFDWLEQFAGRRDEGP